MEIRNPITSLPAVIAQTRQKPPAPSDGPAGLLDAASKESRPGTGLTEYISHGELLDEGGITDYRDLLRAARQQQAPAVDRSPSPVGVSSPYVNRALAAYQSNIAAEDDGTPQPRIDSRV